MKITGLLSKNNLKFLLLGVILLVIFYKHLVMITTIVLLGYIGLITQKLSRIMPHIAIETVTPSAILLGYLYGWPIGLGFGVVVGFGGFLNASILNLTVLIISLVMGFVGVLGALFKAMGLEFWLAYLITYAIRGATTYFLMYITGQDPIENFMHSVVESIYNMTVVIHFMLLIYNIVIILS